MTINFGFVLIYSLSQKISMYNFVKPMLRIRCGFSSFTDLKLVFSVHRARHTHTRTLTQDVCVCILVSCKYKLSSFKLEAVVSFVFTEKPQIYFSSSLWFYIYEGEIGLYAHTFVLFCLHAHQFNLVLIFSANWQFIQSECESINELMDIYYFCVDTSKHHLLTHNLLIVWVWEKLYE